MNRIPPAYYGGWRDWWTLLHPPYTLMHLSFVVVGATLAPELNLRTLLATLLAFFLAVGIAAHALDELAGRPLATNISAHILVLLAILSLGLAVGIGIIGAIVSNIHILWFVIAGVFLAVSYNLELFGGFFHTDLWFGFAWGAFPALTANFAQTGAVDIVSLLGASYAFAIALTQRHLSSPARQLRRKVTSVEGIIRYRDDTTKQIDRPLLLKPLEDALQMLVLSSILIAFTLLGLRLWSGEWVSGFGI